MQVRTDSFAQKSFSPVSYAFSSLAELGFSYCTDGRNGNFEPFEGFPRCMLEKSERCRIPRSYFVDKSGCRKIQLHGYHTRWVCLVDRQVDKALWPDCYFILSFTKQEFRHAVATITEWIKSGGTSSGWVTQSGLNMPNVRT